MKMITRLSFLLLMLWSWNINGQSQITKTPNASPKAFVGQQIGLTDVKVVYHRPAVKGREIWGKMVPDNAVWRAGANDNTIIAFSDDVKIEGESLKAGKYGLHVLPQGEQAIIIFSKSTTAWGSYSYNQYEDALRVTVKPGATGRFYEFLTYEFEQMDKTSAVCVLKWENKKFPFKVEANVHDKVLAGFRNDLRNKAGWTWNGWHEAANYCYQNDINHKEALSWATQSAAMNPNPRNLLLKARLVGKMEAPDDPYKQTDYALSSLEKDLNSLPISWKEWSAAANFAMQNKKYDQALGFAENSIKMRPGMNNMMVKAQVLHAKGNAKEAEKIKEKALSYASNAELNNHGYQLLGSGKVDEAVKVFKINVEKHPKDPNVWDSLGEGYVSQGNKELAIKAFKKSLSLNPPANVRANSMKLLGQLGVNLDEKEMEHKKDEKSMKKSSDKK